MLSEPRTDHAAWAAPGGEILLLGGSYEGGVTTDWSLTADIAHIHVVMQDRPCGGDGCPGLAAAVRDAGRVRGGAGGDGGGDGREPSSRVRGVGLAARPAAATAVQVRQAVAIVPCIDVMAGTGTAVRPTPTLLAGGCW